MGNKGHIFTTAGDSEDATCDLCHAGWLIYKADPQPCKYGKPEMNQIARILFDELVNNEEKTLVQQVEKILPRLERYVYEKELKAEQRGRLDGYAAAEQKYNWERWT